MNNDELFPKKIDYRNNLALDIANSKPRHSAGFTNDPTEAKQSVGIRNFGQRSPLNTAPQDTDIIGTVKTDKGLERKSVISGPSPLSIVDTAIDTALGGSLLSETRKIKANRRIKNNQQVFDRMLSDVDRGISQLNTTSNQLEKFPLESLTFKAGTSHTKNLLETQKEYIKKVSTGEMEAEGVYGAIKDLLSEDVNREIEDSAVKKIDNGEKLNPAEIAVLNMRKLGNIVSPFKESLAYKVTENIGSSTARMAEIGAATAAVIAAAPALATGGIAAALGIAGGVTAISPSTVTNVLDRYYDKIFYDFASDEIFTEKGKSFAEAAIRGVGSSFAENLIEGTGGGIAFITTQTAKKEAGITLTEAVLSAINKGKFDKKAFSESVLKSGQFHGIPGEIWEEEIQAGIDSFINETKYNSPFTEEGFDRMIMSGIVAGAQQSGAITVSNAIDLKKLYKLKYDPATAGTFGGGFSFEEKDGATELPKLDQKRTEEAFRGVSWDADKRAVSVISEYDGKIEAMKTRLDESTLDQDKKTELLSEYANKLHEKTNAWLSAKGRTISPMISGAGNFPVERNRKRIETEMNRSDDLSKFEYSFNKRLEKIEKGAEIEEAGGAFEVAKKELADLKQLQSDMKLANKILRDKKLTDEQKQEQLKTQTSLSDELIKEASTPTYSGRLGFESFSLTNLNNRIKAREKKVNAMSAPTQESGGLHSFDGGKIEMNQEADRVQIFFDEKPTEEQRTMLKKSGWRWSPRFGAWQRKITENAVRNAKRLFPAIETKATEPATKAPDTQSLEQEAMKYDSAEEFINAKRATTESVIPKDSKPFEFSYIRNTEKSPYRGKRFGQDVEPGGKYMTVGRPSKVDGIEKFETGNIRFEKPLVLDFGGGYGTESNWKNVLSDRFNKKTGKELSNEIKKAGYDGIVTVDKSGKHFYTSEIVSLSPKPSKLLEIYNKAHFTRKTTADGKNKYLSKEKDTAPPVINEKTEETQKDTPKKRTVQDIRKEESIMEEFSERLGISKEKIALTFAQLKSDKKVTLDQYAKLLEQKEAQLEEEAKQKAEKEAELDVVEYPIEGSDRLAEMAKDPVNLARAAGMKGTGKLKAIEYLQNLPDVTSSAQLEVLFDDLTRLVDSGQEVSTSELFEVFQEKLQKEHTRLSEAKKTKRAVFTPIMTKKRKAELKRAGKEQQILEEELIDAERKAEFKDKRTKEKEAELRERPTLEKSIKEKIKQFKRGYKKGAAEKAKDLRILQRELAKYARATLTTDKLMKSELNKILVAPIKVVSPEKLEEAFNTIREISQKHIKKTNKEKFEKLLKKADTKKTAGVSKTKTTAEGTLLIDFIKGYAAYTPEQVEIQREINNKILNGEGGADSLATQSDQMGDDLNFNAIISNIALDYAGFDQKLIQQQTQLLKNLNEFLAGEAQKIKERLEGERMKRTAISTAITKSVQGESYTGEEKHLTFFDKIAQNDINVFNSFISQADYLSRSDKASDVGESDLSKFADLGREATIAEGQLQIYAKEKQKEAIEKHFGNNIPRLKKQLKELDESKTIVGLKNEDGTPSNIKMSGLEQASFALQYRQKDSREIILREGVLVGKEKRTRFFPTETQAAQIAKTASPQVMGYVADLKVSIIDHLGSMLTKQIQEKTGRPVPRTEEYFPRKTERLANTFIEGMMEQRYSGVSTTPGFEKSRAKKTGAMILANPIDQINSYIAEASHAIAFNGFTQTGRAVLGNKTFRDSVTNQFGEGVYKGFIESFSNVARGSVQKQDSQGGKVILDTTDGLLDRIIAEQLGGNVGIFIKQLTSIPAFYAKSNPAEAAYDLVQFFSNPKKNTKELYNGSKWLQNRWTLNQFEIEMDRLSKKHAAMQLAGKQTLAQKSMGLIRIGDSAAIVVGGWHTYQKALREGLSKEKAIKKFEKEASSAQQESAMYARNALQNIQYLRFTRLYTTTLFQYWQNATANARAIINGRGTFERTEEYGELYDSILEKALVGDTLNEADSARFETLQKEEPTKLSDKKIATVVMKQSASVAMYWSVLPMIFQFVTDGFEWDNEKQKRAAIFGLAGMFLTLGELITKIFGIVTDENYTSYDSGNPIIDLANDASNLTKAVTKIARRAEEEGKIEITESEARNLKKGGLIAAGLISKISVRNIYNTFEGVSELVTKETDDYRRIFMSKYALGELPFQKKDELKEFIREGDDDEAAKIFNQLSTQGEIKESWEEARRRYFKEIWNIPSVADGEDAGTITKENLDKITRSLSRLKEDRGQDGVDEFIQSYKQKRFIRVYQEALKNEAGQKKGFDWIPSLEKKNKMTDKDRLSLLFKRNKSDKERLAELFK